MALRAFVLLLVLASAPGCKGCREQTNPVADAALVASGEGGTSDAASLENLPWAGVVVARSGGPAVSITPMSEDGIVLRDGLYVYAVDGDGKVTRVGAPADYVPFLWDSEQELAGWEPSFEETREELSGTTARPFVRWEGGRSRTLAWNGTTWTKATDAPLPAEDYRFHSSRYDDPKIARPSTAGLPSGFVWTHPHVTKNGTVWIGHATPPKGSKDEAQHRKQVTAIQPLDGKEGRLIPIPDELDEKKLASRHCNFLQSADDGSYMMCLSSTEDIKQVSSQLLTLEKEKWITFELAKPSVVELQVIDAEGAVWWVAGGNGSPPHLMRRSKDGKTEEIEIPAVPPDLAAPSYSVYLDDPPTPVERRWRSAKVIPKKAPGRTGWIHTLLPRRSGDVWVAGRQSGDITEGSTVMRFVRGGSSSSKPLLLPSNGDARNAILNARGLRTWSGHCNTAFVPFPNDAFYTDRAKEIEAAVAKIDGGKQKVPIQVAIIEGTFDDRRVVGAVFLRSEVEARLEVMEAAVTRVMTIATTNPASRPEVTCSVPAIENVIAILHEP